MDDFLIRAALGGLGVALSAAALGVFVVWRRMAYFGDTLAHSALLGVALGLLFDVAPIYGVLFLTALLALSLMGLERSRLLATDTLLGILSHSALSLGLVALAFLEGVRVDLLAYLFGDILALSWMDVAVIGCGAVVILGGLAAIWSPLLALTVHEDLAAVEGVPVTRVRAIFMLLLAALIATAMKLVGVLLITALLIIPAATARHWSRTPEQMLAIGAGLAMLAVIAGLALSLQWDTPAGPSIVVVAATAFLFARMLPIRAH